MDAAFIAQLTSATRFIQARVGEYLTISAVNYACTEGESFIADVDFETGGAVLNQKGSVIVNKQDLGIAPTRGTIVSFRGAGFRVTNVEDLVANWDIKLIQLSA